LSSAAPLPDYCSVARLVWDSADIGSDGSVLASAFPRRDVLGEIDKLTGMRRFVSVDRTDQMAKVYLVPLVERQLGTVTPEGGERVIPHFAVSGCRTIRDIVDVSGAAPFDTLPEPLADNPAHCGIHNVGGRTGRAYADELRAYLQSAFSKVVPLADMFAS
jgi:hypothetical protein